MLLDHAAPGEAPVAAHPAFTPSDVDLPFTLARRYRCDRGHAWDGPQAVSLTGPDGEALCAKCLNEFMAGGRFKELLAAICGRVTPAVG